MQHRSDPWLAYLVDLGMGALLSMPFHCSSLGDHWSTIFDIEDAFTRLVSPCCLHCMPTSPSRTAFSQSNVRGRATIISWLILPSGCVPPFIDRVYFQLYPRLFGLSSQLSVLPHVCLGLAGIILRHSYLSGPPVLKLYRKYISRHLFTPCTQVTRR